MKSILCLTGWGQEHLSLESSINKFISNKLSVSSLNYSSYNSVADFMFACKQVPNPDVIIGWSLGAQLAIRLQQIAVFKPKLLVLIAPPFQLVKDDKIVSGMTLNVFNQFYKNFSLAPDATLKKFSILSLMNDKNKSEILKNIKIDDYNSKNLVFWLEELKRFSCFEIAFENMPPTIIFAGKGDMVVPVSQMKYFEERIADLDIHYFSNCGHAPHLSDNALFNDILIKKMMSLNLL